MMHEEYLHFLWRMKRLDFNQLKLVNLNQSNVLVKDVGWYNLDSGPDFFNGSVIIDGIQWSGNIEIHLKSSDWYAHEHHLDKAYDNVILHVVYEHDREVYINDRILPTVELKTLIDAKHLDNYQRLISANHHIPCYKNVMEHQLALFQQIDISFIHRIERKGLELLEEFEGRIEDKNSLFYSAIFKSVGGKTNRLPLQQLAQILPFNLIEKEKWDKLRVEALVFGCAGLLNDAFTDEYYVSLREKWLFLKQKNQLVELNTETWKFGGIRPYSFPTFLLAQLSAFLLQVEIRKIDFKKPLELLNLIRNLEHSLIHPYWKNHFKFGVESKPKKLRFSKLFQQNLLINGFIPFLIALKHLKNDFIFADVAVELAERIAPESNRVINYWKEIGFQPKNALESQGLLELNNEFCTFRKCLSCKVGIAILENEKVNTENSLLL